MTAISFYDDPGTERYTLLGNAFGATTASWKWIGIPGRKGIVRDIMARITATMVGTTSVPEIRVGNAASDNSFARWLLGTSATAGYTADTYRARTLCGAAAGRTGSKAVSLSDFANHISLEGNNGAGTVAVAADANNFAYLPADTAFFITGVAGVGGTPAGTADVLVDIDWW